MPLTGIEAGITGIKVLEASFKNFPSVLQRILVEKGIVEPGKPSSPLTEEMWFPLESWLAVHKVIHDEIGSGTMMAMGTRITENRHFPPSIRDIPSALDALDIVLHKSHRKLGCVMYDVATGQMMEGIGNYRTRYIFGHSKAEVTSDTPYPCYVDLSILTGLAQTYERAASVVHAPGDCRQDGDVACKYIITW